MRLLGKRQIPFLLLTLLTLSVFGQIPSRPNPPKLVNDYAQKLTLSEREQLERKLVEFDNSSSVQICIVIIDSLGEYDITQFADELGTKWGVGVKGSDNGVVIVVKPRTGTEKGQARISIGYGLEAVIPDATAGQIVDYEMIPHFKKENYFAGLDSATSTIIKFASGEYTPGKYKKMHRERSSYIYVFALLIIGVVFLLMKALSRKSRGISSHGSGNGLFWILTMMLMGGGGRGGGGFGGGSAGGDFGGFGGGDFGGGGASGEW